MANSRVDDEKLIILVQEHPFLWDLRDSRYKDNFLKKNTWDMIGNQLQINGIVAKNKWRNLRDTFSRKLAELNQPSGSGYKHVRWKYFEQMSFLKDTLTSRPRSGNLEEVEATAPEYLDEYVCEDDLFETEPVDNSLKEAAGKKRRQDGAVLEELVNLEKERHNILKEHKEKTGNYHAMMSFVPLLDSLSEEDQMDAREQIIQFAHRVIREKKGYYN